MDEMACSVDGPVLVSVQDGTERCAVLGHSSLKQSGLIEAHWLTLRGFYTALWLSLLHAISLLASPFHHMTHLLPRLHFDWLPSFACYHVVPSLGLHALPPPFCLLPPRLPLRNTCHTVEPWMHFVCSHPLTHYSFHLWLLGIMPSID